MAMTRAQRHLSTLKARYDAGHHRPATKKQIESWLAPITRALSELRTGYVDTYRGYAVTRIKPNDPDFARIDWCINGFLALLDRLQPEIDLSPMRRVSSKLTHGVLLQPEEIDACLALLKPIAEGLRHFTRAQLKDAANTEMVRIEFERLGVLETA